MAWPSGLPVSTNKRTVSRSRDHFRSMRGQYPSHVITLKQSEVSRLNISSWGGMEIFPQTLIVRLMLLKEDLPQNK